MKQHWEKLRDKVDSLALRERTLIFIAAASVLVALVHVLFLNPLLAQQQELVWQAAQQQEKIKEAQAWIEAILQARREDTDSPQRQRINELKQQLIAGNAYLQSSRERLVQPEKMVGLLEKVLRQNKQLQLVSLKTLPVAPLIDDEVPNKIAASVQPEPVAAKQDLSKQVFKHGVQITVRGSYLDLLQYLTALERLPVQMFWGMAKMEVVQYPTSELTLTIYTLSLDKIWLLV